MLEQSMTALYYPTKWLSKIIMKIIPTEVKIKFRNLEKISLKYSASKAHRQFNIACIYIYIYIYLRRHVTPLEFPGRNCKEQK